MNARKTAPETAPTDDVAQDNTAVDAAQAAPQTPAAKPDDTVTITVYMPKSLKAEARIAAIRKGVSVSEYIVALMLRELDPTNDHA